MFNKSNEPKGGVYCLLNSAVNKLYIGSTLDFQRRKRGHFQDLRRGKHKNRPLQNSFYKHGEDVFSFHILEPSGPEVILANEQAWLDMFSETERYNISPTAGNTTGFHHRPETRARMSSARSGNSHHFWGKKLTDSHRAKMVASHIGKRPSAETKLKMSLAHRDYKPSVEHRKKISVALRGSALSNEHRRNISIALTGRKLSPEQCRAVSVRTKGGRNPFYGKRHSEETRTILSSKLKGRKISEEIRRKMAVSQKQRREREKLCRQV